MPEFSTVEKNGHFRHIVQLKPGERVSLCRCYGSKNFPFCDGTHNQIHSNVGPAVIEVLATSEEKGEETQSSR